MRKNIAKVIQGFLSGKAVQGDSKRTCWTDGKAVYSYNMMLLKRTKDGLEIINKDNSPSRTTSSQIKALHINFPSAIIVDSFNV